MAGVDDERHAPESGSPESLMRRVAAVWIVLCVVLVVAAVVFVILAASWLYDYATGPDATIVQRFVAP